MDDYEAILRLVPSPVSLAEKLAQLTPAGLTLPPIDLGAEQLELQRWLRGVLSSEPPPEGLRGVWLGLVELVGPNDEVITDLYLSGAETFELDDLDVDWACEPSYFPDGRYAGSGFLANLQVRAAAASVDPQDLCLGYLACLAGPLLESVRDLLPDGLGVAVGWDSGTPLYLGYLREPGFAYRDPAEAAQALGESLADREAFLDLPDDTPALTIPDDPTPDQLREWARARTLAWEAFRRARIEAREAGLRE